jgi:hypothetical protein
MTRSELENLLLAAIRDIRATEPRIRYELPELLSDVKRMLAAGP